MDEWCHDISIFTGAKANERTYDKTGILSVEYLNIEYRWKNMCRSLHKNDFNNRLEKKSERTQTIKFFPKSYIIL